MKIAVASGKGGTGKTTVAVSLAWHLSQDNSTAYLDCDVEEPNGHIFLNPEITEEVEATLPVPDVNEDLCTGCGICSNICAYNAVVTIGDTPMVFQDLCHACGGCFHACPENAITEIPHRVGFIEKGHAGSIEFIHGKLDIGKAFSPPIIREVKRHAPEREMLIYDCPPGTSCPVIAAIGGSDYVVLVTEATPFGLHDLMLTVDTVKEIGIPMGVVINRSGQGTPETLQYCKRVGIPVIAEIPFDRTIAECYSNGGVIARDLPQFGSSFEAVAKAVRAAGTGKKI